MALIRDVTLQRVEARDVEGLGRVRVYTVYGREPVFTDENDVVVGDLMGLRLASAVPGEIPDPMPDPDPDPSVSPGPRVISVSELPVVFEVPHIHEGDPRIDDDPILDGRRGHMSGCSVGLGGSAPAPIALLGLVGLAWVRRRR